MSEMCVLVRFYLTLSGADLFAIFQAQVYVEAQYLFKAAPDLLEEFKVFFPEPIWDQGGLVILPQPSGAPWPQSDPSLDKPVKKPVPRDVANRDPTSMTPHLLSNAGGRKEAGGVPPN
jgi:hypothetical protein